MHEPRHPIRSTAKTPKILFEWPADSIHKSIMKSCFLFEWKTST
jgi:hypothetical protein